MRTLLVITKQPTLAGALHTVLDLIKFQLITKEAVGEAEVLLARGAIDATILDVELTDTRATRAIEELKTFAPGCPIIIYTGEKQWEWEGGRVSARRRPCAQQASARQIAQHAARPDVPGSR